MARFMKGVFNLRPSLPRYTCTWDVTDVLNHLKNLALSTIDLKTLSKKLALLLLLLSGQRLQTIYTLKVSNIHISSCGCSIFLDSLLKTSRPCHHKSHLNFNYYSDTNLCVIAHLERYISLTQSVRGTSDSLFISYCKPYKPVSRDTISRWVKHLLHESGIDIKTFSTHSTRAASTSKGCELGIPVEHILAAASWSNAKTFAKFYKKPIETTRNQTSFGKELLDNVFQNDTSA